MDIKINNEQTISVDRLLHFQQMTSFVVGIHSIKIEIFFFQKINKSQFGENKNDNKYKT